MRIRFFQRVKLIIKVSRNFRITFQKSARETTSCLSVKHHTNKLHTMIVNYVLYSNDIQNLIRIKTFQRAKLRIKVKK